ncbi:MAG: FAD-dependent oxidoreductase [Candidatus Aureabacteria bacterium]|nr:FAD-dependent oxidoreductase [Candidatus Auribacterota bacterium]NLW94377.1 FAD-dependent oxidoreductase [Chlamydiota bacterium]HQM52006.1 FAD-dependent oxidoreductase [bacterium]
MKKSAALKTCPGNVLLTDAQLKAELAKCEYCAEKPCKAACPCDCSPFDFIRAAKVGNPSDIRRAAAQIMRQNPLGGVCGMVCPDRHCMQACVHERFDSPVNIPAVQATIIARAKAMGVMPRFASPPPNGRRVAVVGAGPAGLGAAIVLAQRGYAVDIFESEKKAGGMCACIPAHRLPRAVLESDLRWVFFMDRISLKSGKRIQAPEKLLERGYGAVVVAPGLWAPVRMGIPGEDRAVFGIDYLKNPASFRMKGRRVAVIGGGASALDCAVTAAGSGAAAVEMFALESIGEMPLTPRERQEMRAHGIEVSGRTKVTAILARGGKVAGLRTVKVELPAGKRFGPKAIREVKGSAQERPGFDRVIVAIGARPGLVSSRAKGVFFAGDAATGPTTVVEAAAAGKNAAAQADAFLSGDTPPRIEKATKSAIAVPGYEFEPVSLETEFLGRRLSAPFLLSASPATDGYDQAVKAYEAGWPGVILKTAFDNLPIHIPAGYMNCFSDETWGNCDNVSDHTLDRVCEEVGRLVKRYPDRLTAASTGGTVSGNDEADRLSWQGNTKKLEKAGAMLIEYSLSCPQGGEGAEGDIVSQNAALTAKIIGWVLEAGDPAVPKLFKLTSAVTDIKVILRAVRKAFEARPGAKAGVTLANTFPTLCFKPGRKKEWEEGVVVGMSGEGVTPISYLCLANAGGMGVAISGNAGPMDYKAAADFLALGAGTVQFCTAVERCGYGVIDDLRSGLSHLMQDRGIRSVRELVGRAQPEPIRDFMALSGEKLISEADPDLCVSCGNCTRCPYLAISLDKNLHPVTDAERCVGCSLCSLQCFVGAIRMRERTAKEKKK